MAVKGKTRVCQCALADFNIELINGSPFYNRYPEFLRVFRKHLRDLNPELVFAQPQANAAQGTVDWYIPIDAPEVESLESLRATDPEEYQRYGAIRERTVQSLREAQGVMTNPQERAYMALAMKHLESPYAERATYCADGQVSFALWGMAMRRGRTFETVITEDVRDHRFHTVRYAVQGEGTLQGPAELARKHGHVLQGQRDIPVVEAAEGHCFTRWEPAAPQGQPVTADLAFTAVCTPVAPSPPEAAPAFVAAPEPAPAVPETPPVVEHDVTFRPGDFGALEGLASWRVAHGDVLRPEQVPDVQPLDDYEFVGWDRPVGQPVTEDSVFTATYRKRPVPPPQKKGRGCLEWLIYALLALLLLLLAAFLLRACFVDHTPTGAPIDHVHEHPVLVGDTVVEQVERRHTDGGTDIDDNGTFAVITGPLPDDRSVVTPPMSGADGAPIPIHERDDRPDVAAGRLFLFMYDDNDLDGLAAQFEQTYGEEGYGILGFDRAVPYLVVQVPEAERDQVRQTINQRIPDHKFLCIDETIYQLSAAAPQAAATPGWHLKAVHAQQAWQTSKGKAEVTVAVVDDGIDAAHPMFRSRIAGAYNVFRQDNHLSRGEGHGTHVAGLAVGSAEYLSRGAAGLAPACRLMPVQVFDNGLCSLSSLVAGIMYAVNRGADVVNVSIGMNVPALGGLTPEQQRQLADTEFKNEERLWERICQIAQEKKSILVFAAGNDHALARIAPNNRSDISITVAAVDPNQSATAFTNHGAGADISAPGVGIVSAFPAGALQSMDGTSMAAPIVTGIVALMKSADRSLTAQKVLDILRRTGVPTRGDVPPMVQADKALKAVGARAA